MVKKTMATNDVARGVVSRVETEDELAKKYVNLEEQAKQRQGTIDELDKKIDTLDKKELEFVQSASGR